MGISPWVTASALTVFSCHNPRDPQKNVVIVVKRMVESAVHLQGSPTASAHSTVHQILVNVKIHFLSFETHHATSKCDALLIKCGSIMLDGKEVDAKLNLVRRVNWVE